MGRKDKVQEAVRKEVSEILQNELKDPRMGFVTVTSVDMSPDLRYAKIFYSVLGTEENKKRSKEALESARGFIRKLVAERVKMRFAPELMFKLDESGEYSIRIEEVLNEIKELGPEKGEDKGTKETGEGNDEH